jgi:hypothetical protein
MAERGGREMSGWIKVHRKIQEWEWYTDSKSVHLFIHILIKANHVARKWRGIDIMPGQFITSRDKLAAETGISAQSVRTILQRMKDTNELTIKSTSQYTMVSVCNWATYQTDVGDINQLINQQSTSELTNNQPATNQQLTTTKNDKKVKNEKKRTKREQHEAAVFASAPPEKFQDIRFCETWQDFCDHRAEKGAWLTERAIKTIFKKLAHFSIDQAIECLDNSIAGNWTSVVPDSVKTKSKSYGTPKQTITQMPTEEQYLASETVERDENGVGIF